MIRSNVEVAVFVGLVLFPPYTNHVVRPNEQVVDGGDLAFGQPLALNRLNKPDPPPPPPPKTTPQPKPR